MFLESFDGTKIYYRIKRNSNLFLVFVHSWATDWTIWKKEIGFFEKKGYSIVTLDLRGHGQSDKPESKRKYLLECFAKDIHEIITKENIKHFILIGHSMGGMISLVYYKLFYKNKHIKGLVLCDTTCRNVLKHKTIKFISPFIKHVLDFIISHEHINKAHFSHLNNIDLTKYNGYSDNFVFYKGLHNTPMKSVFACLESMMKYDVKPILRKISIPVLIIEGGRDKLLPKIDSIELYGEIKSAELDFIPKGKHFVNIDSPKLVDKYTFNFLKRHNLGSGEINKKH
jgi:pimeloyl-ACP methyl ester carboxylesterase